MTQIEVAAEAVKASPPLAVVAAPFAGLDVPALVQDVTLIYLLLLVGHKVWRIWREYKDGITKGAPDDAGE